MKKVILVLLSVVLCMSLFADYIECGGGTVGTSYVPVYGFYDYTWSRTIYKAEDLQSTAITITGVQFHLYNNTSNYLMPNQSVYIQHTTDEIISSDPYIDPATSGATKVYEGSINFNGSVGDWFEIDFNTNDFEYNGTDNIIIYYENRDGNYASGYPRWYCQNVPTSCIYKYADGTFPSTTGTISSYKPNIRFNYGESQAPVCPQVTNMTPENGSNNIQPDGLYSWTAIPEVAGYTRGYEVTFNNEVPVDQTEVTFDLGESLEYSTEYTWSVKPYYLATSKYSITPSPTKIYPTTEPEVYNFYTIAGLMTETANEENPVNWTVIVVPEGAIPVVPVILATLPTEGYAYQPLFALTYNFEISGTYIIYIGAPYIDGSIYHIFIGGRELELDVEWEIDEGIFTMMYEYDGSKGDVDIVITNDEDNTLPVELSSFNAVAQADQFVTLQWVTESESNLLGYNVYRAESENFSQAMRINPIVVPANNQSQTSTYSYTDSEIENTTYYYWLEVAELANENSFHGPIVVTVEDEAVVEGVTATQFGNFGPTPFTESTTSSLRVKEGETASVTVYNLLGQVISRETFNAGEHDFTFNGRDLNNKKVANGIYFVKMSSPSASRSFKIVKIK